MRNILVFLLAFSIGLQHTMQLSLFAWYSINKQVIAEKLCVNKANPKLHCEGKCYLGKQLQKAEEGEKKSAANILKEKNEFISNHSMIQCFQPYQTKTSKLYYPTSLNLPNSPVFDVIHPPG